MIVDAESTSDLAAGGNGRHDHAIPHDVDHLAPAGRLHRAGTLSAVG